MARTSSIEKAEALLAVYEKYASQLKPAVIHSKLSDAIKRQRIRDIQTSSKIRTSVKTTSSGIQSFP